MNLTKGITMKNIFISTILALLLLFFTACPGDQPESDTDSSVEVSVDTQGEDTAERSGKSIEELLTQLLFTHGLETVVMTLDDQVAVQYYQPPVESDMDVLLTWHTIALGALDVYGPNNDCVITQLIEGNPEVMITIPLASVSDFRENKISFEEYRKTFHVIFPNNPNMPQNNSGGEESDSYDTTEGELNLVEIIPGGALVQGILGDDETIFGFMAEEVGIYEITCQAENNELFIFVIMDEDFMELGDNISEDETTLNNSIVMGCNPGATYFITTIHLEDADIGSQFSISVNMQ